jgi:16S rRNA (guanine(527)-N(7))-methyltransferase RsmG
MIEALKSYLISGLGKFIYNPDKSVIESFTLFYDELTKWSEKMNLTSLSGEELIKKLFFESLLVFKCHNIEDDMRILDIGTGVGIPGLPLKIVNNDLELHFLEKDKKKMAFLKNLIYKLSLKNVFFHQDRIEDFVDEFEFPCYFDVITSRAVSFDEDTISDFAKILKGVGLYIRKGCSDYNGTYEFAREANIKSPFDDDRYNFFIYSKDDLLNMKVKCNV